MGDEQMLLSQWMCQIDDLQQISIVDRLHFGVTFKSAVTIEIAQ